MTSAGDGASLTDTLANFYPEDLMSDVGDLARAQTT